MLRDEIAQVPDRPVVYLLLPRGIEQRVGHIARYSRPAQGQGVAGIELDAIVGADSVAGNLHRLGRVRRNCGDILETGELETETVLRLLVALHVKRVRPGAKCPRGQIGL